MKNFQNITNFLIALSSFLLVGCSEESEKICAPGFEFCQCTKENECYNSMQCVFKHCIKSEKSKEVEEKLPKTNCKTLSECLDTEICSNEGYCNDVSNYYFNIIVTEYFPKSCVEHPEKPEIYYFEYYQNNKYQNTSGNNKNCPNNWETTELFYDPVLNFRLDFYKLTEKEIYESFCWENEKHSCLQIPKQVLSEGYYRNGNVELLIEPIL